MASPAACQSRRQRGLSPETSPHPVRRRRIGGPSKDNLVEANTSVATPATPSVGEALDNLVGHPSGVVSESHFEKEKTTPDSTLFGRVVVEDLRDTSAHPTKPPITYLHGPLLVHIMDPMFHSIMSGPPATSSVGGTGSASMYSSVPCLQ